MELIIHSLLLFLFTTLSHSLKHQVPIAPQDSFQVPGKNPLYFCEDPKDYILEIHYIDIDPNPPQAGKNLTIEASGYLFQDLKKNSTVSYEVRIRVGGSSIPFIKEKRDVCEYVGEFGEECPIEKGNVTFSRKFELPKEIPQATYLVKSEVWNEEEETVTCVKATVEF